MKKVFIIHGFGGIPNGGWISWLMKKLAEKEIFACALPMPDSKNPVVSKWIEEISHAINNSQEDGIFLVGHSLGVPAILRYLEVIPTNKKISCVFLVSGLIDSLDSDNSESIFRAIDSFVVPPIDFEKVKNKSKKFIVLHSIDDPIVPFSNAEKISNNLDCKLIRTEKGGHFFIVSEPICHEFPELFKIIEEVIN